MDEERHDSSQRRRTASTRVVVEAAVNFSKGANHDTWEAYRSEESRSISPWRRGGFFIDERFSKGSEGTEDV
jgi:hypothetical protein